MTERIGLNDAPRAHSVASNSAISPATRTNAANAAYLPARIARAYALAQPLEVLERVHRLVRMSTSLRLSRDHGHFTPVLVNRDNESLSSSEPAQHASRRLVPDDDRVRAGVRFVLEALLHLGSQEGIEGSVSAPRRVDRSRGLSSLLSHLEQSY
jgi:hypothetical protein